MDGTLKTMASILPPIITTTATASTIPITTNADPNSYRVVFSVPATGLGPGKIVLAETQVEFVHGTTQYTYLVSVTRQIIRATSPTATTGTAVTPPIAGDVGPGEWSSVFSLMGTDSNIPAGDYYYNVVMFASSASATPGDTITIPSGYGDCSILIMSQ